MSIIKQCVGRFAYQYLKISAIYLGNGKVTVFLFFFLSCSLSFFRGGGPLGITFHGATPGKIRWAEGAIIRLFSCVGHNAYLKSCTDTQFLSTKMATSHVSLPLVPHLGLLFSSEGPISTLVWDFSPKRLWVCCLMFLLFS